MPDTRVLLIGGPPGVGKTTLGRAIAEAANMTSVTGDILATSIRAVTTPESHRPFFPTAGRGHTAYFTDGPPTTLIADAEDLQEAMWPVVARTVSSHIGRDDPMVLDWWLLSPRHVATLDDERVKSVWMWIDPDVLLQRERMNTDFLEGSADPTRMLANFMKRSLWRNELVRSEAKKLRLPVIRQDGDKSVADLVSEVFQAVGWQLPT